MSTAIVFQFIAIVTMIPIEVKFETNSASGDEYLNFDEENVSTRKVFTD